MPRFKVSRAMAALIACQILVLGFLFQQTYLSDWTGGVTVADAPAVDPGAVQHDR